MRVTSKNEIIIPIEIREPLAILLYAEVELDLMDGWAKLFKEDDGERGPE